MGTHHGLVIYSFLMIKKTVLILFLVLSFSFFKAAKTLAADIVRAENSAILLSRSEKEDDADWRYLSLYLFLKEYDSPLAKFSDQFIESADIWQIDWRLVPAIAGLESFFGRRMVPETYNAYGWGGGYIGFESWEDSIDHVSRKISQNYYRRGLNDPFKIGPVYAPPNSKWGSLVASIMNNI